MHNFEIAQYYECAVQQVSTGVVLNDYNTIIIIWLVHFLNPNLIIILPHFTQCYIVVKHIQLKVRSQLAISCLM